MRQLSNAFVDDLKNIDGILRPLLDRVKQDHTLHLAIRNEYINIYYRGGNLLRLVKADRGYITFFDDNYNIDKDTINSFPKIINSKIDSVKCIQMFSCFKEVMDLYFSNYSKPEREFQQLVVRENNFSTISNESEYFISDIEFADSSLNARYDMLGIHWAASQRKDGCNCRPVFIEMKYGDNALEGNSGLMKHLRDIDFLISDKENHSKILSLIASQCNQLDDLGLLNFNRSSNWKKFDCKFEGNTEVIFILANHNPRSSVLKKIINSPEIHIYEHGKNFDIKFFVSSFSGYSMHSKCMFSLSQLRNFLDSYYI